MRMARISASLLPRAGSSRNGVGEAALKDPAPRHGAFIEPVFAGEKVAGLDVTAVEEQVRPANLIDRRAHAFRLHGKRPVDPGGLEPGAGFQMGGGGGGVRGARG